MSKFLLFTLITILYNVFNYNINNLCQTKLKTLNIRNYFFHSVKILFINKKFIFLKRIQI